MELLYRQHTCEYALCRPVDPPLYMYTAPLLSASPFPPNGAPTATSEMHSNDYYITSAHKITF